MSNERSPRAVCSTTIGMRGDTVPPWYSATDELRDISATGRLPIQEVPMSDSVTRETVLDLDRDDAWHAVTDADELEPRLADDGEIDLAEGGALHVRLHDGRAAHRTVEEATAPAQVRSPAH